VYGDEARAWADARGRQLSERLELAGETAFCYARDAAPLLADLANQHSVRYLHRPANLEDLFIKLTGRELRAIHRRGDRLILQTSAGDLETLCYALGYPSASRDSERPHDPTKDHRRQDLERPRRHAGRRPAGHPAAGPGAAGQPRCTGRGIQHAATGQGRSPWLRFREVRNARWYDGNVVLVGDAAHTTHFSIGSGTVLALGDAIALADVLGPGADTDMRAALDEYQRRRQAALESRGRAAAISQRWFETVEHRLDTADPVRFAYELINRQGDQPSWRYPLHVMTQNPVLRRGRRVLTTARQQRREVRRT